MKFSKTLQHIGEVDRTYGAQYVQYKLLKKFLKEMKDGSTEEATFVQMVETEHNRVTKIAECKLSELQLTCGGLITNLRAQQISTKRPLEEKIAQLQSLGQHADELGVQLAALERYVHYNKEGFRKIVKKHDKRNKVPLSWMETQRMRTVFVRYLSDLERLLVELSDIYKHIKESTEGDMTGEHTVSDETFERKSYKYWVAAEDVFELKTRLVKHLPIHIFNRKSEGLGGTLTSTADILLEPKEITETGVKYDQLGWISSVYLDNDDLDCYRTRLNMEEGATLLRVRWYGDPKDLQRTDNMILPRAPEVGLYLERKTHHESWVQESSLKERFPIQESTVTKFMAGEMTPDDVTKGDSSVRLAEEMQQEVKKRKLHAVIRTCYKRTAFQLETTNDVRITLDTELTFVNDNPRYFKADQWKRSEKDVDTYGDWDQFPFAVLEVKLKSGEPQWLQDILDAPYIRQVHKFSKFQQACATFYPDKVHMFPYWFTKEDIAHSKTMARKMQANFNENSIEAPVAETPKGTSQSYSNPAYLADDALTEIKVEKPNEIQTLYSEEKKVFRDPSVVRREPNTSESVGDWSANRSSSASYGGIPGKNPTDDKNAKLATKRVKIEPKTFFANERTYLQWLRTGINLFSVGGVLYNLATDDAALYSGIAFLILSLFIMTYAIFIYYWRIYMIKYRKSQRFDDWFGPAMVYVIMLAALTTTIVFHFIYAEDETTPPAKGLTPTAKIPVIGLPAFYEPRGLTFDPSRDDVTWTCSDGLITSVKTGTGKVINNVPVKGNPLFRCRGLASMTSPAMFVAVTEDTDGRYTVVFYDHVTRTINNKLRLDFVTGTVTGVTFAPVLLQPFESQGFLYGGTFLVSTDTFITAIQLYTESDDVTVHPHVFHIPLPAKYLSTGPLASDADYMYVLAHPRNPDELDDLLVYRVTDGSMVCVQPIKSTGFERGMTVSRSRENVYNVTLLEESSLELRHYEFDPSDCSTVKDEL